MNYCKASYLLIVFLVSVQFCYGQLDQEGKNVLYTKETLFGFNIHTNGLGFSLKKGNILDIQNKRQDAKRAYRACIRLKNHTVAISLAKQYLNEPFKG